MWKSRDEDTKQRDSTDDQIRGEKEEERKVEIKGSQGRGL